MTALSAAALTLHKQGLHVFPADHPDQPDCIGKHDPATSPCDGTRGKHPAIKWGVWAVAATAEMISQAWANRGNLANIAIACGPSNLVILDEDEAGELDRWCASYGITLPDTYTVTTGRGRHLYFRWDHSAQRIGNSPKAMNGCKIDVRGDGGFAIGEGSRHESGATYTGNGQPITDLPQEVADLLVAGQTRQQPNWRHVPTAPRTDPNTAMLADGERHKKLVAYAGRLLKSGIDYSEAEILFRERWLLCEQPDGQIPEAQFHTPTCRFPVTWDEAKGKLGSVFGLYPPGQTLGSAPKAKKKAKAPKPQAANVSYAKTSPGGPSRLDDAHIGEYIADKYLKSRFLSTRGLGWMEYDGRRWASAAEPVVGEAVRLAVLDLYSTEANAGADVDRLKKISSLFYASKIFAIVRIAKGYLWAKEEEFDAHPDLLNVRNGVVDLRDGTLRKHDPALRFTKLCPCDYLPGAVHKDWQQALRALPDDDVVNWLQLRLGQGLTGYPTPDDVLVFLEGGGENGKTTIVDAIRNAVGHDYAVTLPDRVLLGHTGDHPTELMTLRGARLAFMEELPEQHLNIKRLKDTHGKGSISARLCGKDSVEWEPTHTIFVTTNHRPRIDEPEHAVWRRLAMVCFPYRYRKPYEAIEGAMDRRGDPGLRERLRRGGQGRHEAVLAWLIKGAMRWHQDGQQMPEPPAAVVAARDAWQASVDLLLRYAVDNLVPEPNHHVMSTELYQDFAQWLKDNGHSMWSDQLFAARLEQHSLMKAKSVTRRRVRRSAAGQTLSRRTTWAGSYARSVPADKYWAWLGVRFRTPSDVFGPDDRNGW